MPKKNVSLWREKFQRTLARDRRNLKRLQELGWEVLVLWECLIADGEPLVAQLTAFLGG
jgi:DNA mismatch endonuclease (patch repair protein)